MAEIFTSLGYILYIVLLLGALVVVPLGFPGTWLMVGVAGFYSLISDFHVGHSDVWVMAVLILLALTAEVLEFFVGIWGSKQAQVSTGAVVCSLIGGFIGVFAGVPVPIIGSLIGLLGGVFAGAYLYELLLTRDSKKSLTSAKAVFFSRVVSIFVKTVVAFGMVIYIFYKTF